MTALPAILLFFVFCVFALVIIADICGFFIDIVDYYKHEREIEEMDRLGYFLCPFCKTGIFVPRLENSQKCQFCVKRYGDDG